MNASSLCCVQKNYTHPCLDESGEGGRASLIADASAALAKMPSRRAPRHRCGVLGWICLARYALRHETGLKRSGPACCATDSRGLQPWELQDEELEPSGLLLCSGSLHRYSMVLDLWIYIYLPPGMPPKDVAPALRQLDDDAALARARTVLSGFPVG